MLQIFVNSKFLESAFEFRLQKIMYYCKCLEIGVNDEIFGSESDEMERYIKETSDEMNKKFTE
jgi:hypothetical protein